MRWIALLLVTSAMVSCGGSVEETTTTSTSAPPTLDAEAEAFVAALASTGASLAGDDALALGRDICRSLRVLQAAGVQGAGAADALRTVDLDGATTGELATYGKVLDAASRTLCPDASFYARDVSYWLGV